MLTVTSHRAFTGSIISAIVLLTLSSHAVADTWSPIDSIYFTDANQYYGAQLAVDEVRFLPPESQQVVGTLLVAVTDGSDGVRLYSFDTDSSTFTFEDAITVEVTDINDPIAWTPSFMELDFDGSGDESCLVIPTLSNGTTNGSISIVRLTERDSLGDLLVEHDCFYCGFNHGSVYHVTELPSTALADYAISTQSDDDPPLNRIVLAGYDSDNSYFENENSLIVPNIYYGTFHGAVPARTWVTKVQDFRYGSLNRPLCYTTNHNGGILVWDPADSTDWVVSRIGVSQCGGWDYEVGSIDIGGELGDVHRAVVLEGGSSTVTDLGSIQVDNRLLFYSNNTMGLMICDISKPDAPQHIFQWDGDTRPCEETPKGDDWDWHGAGDMDDDTIVQADPGEYAARTFGIGVASESTVADPPVIHVYLAGGIDGLRLFDFSEFLNPFGTVTDGESNFDDFSIDRYDDTYIISQDTMQAFDLQTFSEDGDTWIFTSWRETHENEDGHIGLTVHLDENVVSD